MQARGEEASLIASARPCDGALCFHSTAEDCAKHTEERAPHRGVSPCDTDSDSEFEVMIDPEETETGMRREKLLQPQRRNDSVE